MKRTYEPLLDPGIHSGTISDVREKCVTKFENGGSGNPKVRKKIIEGFEDFLDELQTFGTPFEVWVNGSFVTEKPRPNDIDVVIFGDLNSLSPSEVTRFKNFKARARQRYMTHAHFSPRGDVHMRSYWRGLFTYNREEELKGIFSIDLSQQ